jgi:sulfur-oxidizing protein SoxZ
MSVDAKPRVRVPRSANAGEAVELKTLISHPMESGTRRNNSGDLIPRQIINRFTCEFNGRMVIDIEVEPGVSTNPYFEFYATVDASGEFLFSWYDDDGSVYTETSAITVG